MADSKAEKLTVNIIDGRNDIIYTDLIMNNGGFSKIYNLAQVNSDNLTIQVKDNYKIVGTINY